MDMSDEQLVNMIVSRLDRLDGKMDTLAEAMATQARIEERLANQTIGMKYLEEDIEKLESRTTRLERFHWKTVGVATSVATIGGYFGSTIIENLFG